MKETLSFFIMTENEYIALYLHCMRLINNGSQPVQPTVLFSLFLDCW